MRRSRPLSFSPVRCAELALLGLLLASSAPADVGPPSDLRRSLELAIGPLHEGSLLEGERLTLALRAVWRFSNPWAVELSLGDHREGRYGNFEATTLELGLRRSLIRNEIVDFFVLGGVGVAEGSADVWLQPSGPCEILVRERVDEDSWTGHLGLGVEIALGERWFLRTELRERLLGELEVLDVLLDREATLSWGRRF